MWLADLGLAAKVRPVLILSIPAIEIDRALVTVVPHTTSLRGSRFEVKLSVPFLLRHGAFDTQNLNTVPLSQLLRPLGRMSQAQLLEIEKGVSFWLGLQIPKVA